MRINVDVAADVDRDVVGGVWISIIDRNNAVRAAQIDQVAFSPGEPQNASRWLPSLVPKSTAMPRLETL